jgi:hypothetical protein
MPMKYTLTLFTVLLMTLPASLCAAEFHVAPNGNDANPGTGAKPFATLERGRDAARKLKAQSSKSKSSFAAGRMSWRDRSS